MGGIARASAKRYDPDIMDAMAIVGSIIADIDRIEKESADLLRQAAGIAAKRDRLDKELLELQSALAIIKRKVAASGGPDAAAVDISPEEVVREALRTAGHSMRTPQLTDALRGAGKLFPLGITPDTYAAQVAASAGLVSEGRGWWRFPAAATTVDEQRVAASKGEIIGSEHRVVGDGRAYALDEPNPTENGGDGHDVTTG